MKKVWLLSILALMGCRHYPLRAQVPVAPYRTPRVTFTTSTGQPLSGGCVFTYQGGTTTPAATYTDYTGGVANSNPVILDSTGSAVIWLAANTYKYVVYSNGGTNCALGSLQYTVDQVPGDEWINGTISGATITVAAIVSSTIDSSTIGGTTPAPVNGSYFNGPIGTGGGTPAAGAFSSLAAQVDNVPFSGTPVFNASSYGIFEMTLTNNVTSSTITGGQTGQHITFNICENGTGGYTFAWPTNLTYLLYNLGNGTIPAFSLAPGGCTTFGAFNTGAGWIIDSEIRQYILGNLQVMTFSATPAFNVNSYTSFLMTLTGNVTSSTITGNSEVNGQEINIQVCQDGTGGRTFTWPSSLANAPAVNTSRLTCTSVIAVQNILNGSQPWTVISSTTGTASTTSSQVQVATPAAPASSSPTMQGMAVPFTPIATGRVHGQYSSTITCGTLTTPSNAVSFTFYYGTGTAPTNGTAVTGTNITISSIPVEITYQIPGTVTSGDVQVPVSKDFIISGLNLGTAYWFDAAAAYGGTTGCGATSAQITLQEF